MRLLINDPEILSRSSFEIVFELVWMGGYIC